jgi:hypothetical protein
MMPVDGGENVVRRQALRTLRMLWKRHASCRVCTSFLHTNIVNTNGALMIYTHLMMPVDGGEYLVRRQALRTLVY